jgi:hypothetical protein
MTLDELFESLQEINAELSGEIIYEGDVLKWKYDSFGVFDGEHLTVHEHLEEIYESDKLILFEQYEEELDSFFLTEPEYDDTFVFFYIEK